VNLAIIAKPLRGVTVVRVDVCKCNREVDEEEVEVINAPQVQLVLGERFRL
jgi:hypothetical protein